MMIFNRLNWFLLSCSAILFVGCAQVGTYNPTYFEYFPSVYPTKLAGRAGIEMSKSEQAEVFTGRPTSFTGGATTLNLPIGQILKEGAILAFGDLYAEGAEVVDSASLAGKYAAIFRPRLRSLTYEYNGLKNAGFAVTPTAVVAIEVGLKSPDGKQVWSQTIDSGQVEGPTYFLSGNPGEEISKAAHKAVLKTLQTAARAAYEKAARVTQQGSESDRSGAAL